MVDSSRDEGGEPRHPKGQKGAHASGECQSIALYIQGYQSDFGDMLTAKSESAFIDAATKVIGRSLTEEFLTKAMKDIDATLLPTQHGFPNLQEAMQAIAGVNGMRDKTIRKAQPISILSRFHMEEKTGHPEKIRDLREHVMGQTFIKPAVGGLNKEDRIAAIDGVILNAIENLLEANPHLNAKKLDDLHEAIFLEVIHMNSRARAAGRRPGGSQGRSLGES